MNDNSQLTPPAPEGPTPAGGGQGGGSPAAPASPSFWARWHWPIIGAGGALVLVAAAAVALLLVLKPAPSIDRMVPASADVYLNINLDPSVSQKMNLLQAVHHFPDASTDQKISDLLDKSLKDSGLSYSHDIQPWLGSGIGLAAKIPSGNASSAGSKQAPSAVFVISKDDTRAQAFLSNVRAGKYSVPTGQKKVFQTTGVKPYSAQDYTWSDRSYDGVTITVGTPKAAGVEPIVYALFDHVVVVTNDEGFMHEVIDTEHGRAARLVDTAQYKATLAKLPTDYIAVGYLNGKNLAARVKDQLRTPAMSGLSGLSGLNDLDAFQGAAVVISARSDGIVADAAVKIDSSKLSASTRQALANAGHPDKVVGWVPASSDAFLAFGNLRQTIQSLLDQVGNQPSVQQSTDEIGLTGPHGVLSHLTGDFALEVEINKSFIPAGGIMIGTDNATAMRTFFAGIFTLASATTGEPVAPTKTTYRGVALTTLSMASLGPADLFAPTYAVVDGMGVVASNVAEMKAIIDAHKNQSGIDHDATYETASQASLSNYGSVFYVNIGRLVNTLQSVPAGSTVGTLGLKSNPNLAPLRAFIVTSSSSPDGFLERLILFIE